MNVVKFSNQILSGLCQIKIKRNWWRKDAMLLFFYDETNNTYARTGKVVMLYNEKNFAISHNDIFNRQAYL